MAAIKINLAGNSAVPFDLDILTRPSSNGSRKDSKTLRSNSGNSSRKSKPRCARVTSPGLGLELPPITEVYEALWCGARNGGWQAYSSWSVPAMECMAVTSSDSSKVS